MINEVLDGGAGVEVSEVAEVQPAFFVPCTVEDRGCPGEGVAGEEGDSTLAVYGL